MLLDGECGGLASILASLYFFIIKEKLDLGHDQTSCL